MEEDQRVKSGRSKRKFYPFIELCTKILSDDPLFFLVNSYTTGLQPAVLTYMLETQVAAKFWWKSSLR